jgi:CRP-like cAMP-binding protein
MKILLASASRTAWKVFRDILEKMGHAPGDIVGVADRQSTFAALRDPAAAVDLAVVDWDLTGLDGLALARYLQTSGRAGKVRVLFCIKPEQREAASEAAGLGPHDWIERPFTDEEFRTKVRALGGPEKKKVDESAKSLPAVASGETGEFSLPFLLQLPSNLIEDLLKHCARRRAAAGTVLLRPGERVEALHVVTRGQIEILETSRMVPPRPSGEGDPFGELSFLTAQPASQTVRATTEVEVASVSKAALADVLRRQPQLADHLSALLGRHSKVLTARATTLAHSDFKGTMDTMSFADLIQLLSSTRKTGVLGFRDGARSGAVYLESGEAVHAWTDDLKGEDAFYELAGWKVARFAFTSIQRQEPRTLRVATMTLLMEAMRRLDGDSRETAAAPPPETGAR